MQSMLPDEVVMSKIFLIRGRKVMLDMDLAELYGVETKRLNEQVKRNINRFPKDFMFQLTIEEFENLKSQIATSSWGSRSDLILLGPYYRLFIDPAPYSIFLPVNVAVKKRFFL